MKILGLGGSIHDFSACILSGDKLYAIEDERITKIRYSENSKNPCTPSCNYLFDCCKIKESEIEYFIFNDDLTDIVNSSFGLHKQKFAINHHLAHAYSSFFTSEFTQSAILIVDGAGSKKDFKNNSDETRETTSFYFGDGQSVNQIKKIYGTLDGYNPVSKSQTIMTNSIGEFYRVVAEGIGLGWLSGPGKMMGMSSYGNVNNEYIDYLLESVTFEINGEFSINTNGENSLIDRVFLLKNQIEQSKSDQFILYATLARSAQIIFEHLLVHSLDYLYELTKNDNLCLAGGVALNSVANGVIRERTKFKNIHIVAYPGDHGLSIGAALWGYYNLEQKVKDKKFRFSCAPFLGKTYNDEEIIYALDSSSLNYTKSKHINKEIAKYINEGKVVARFKASSEFGPRALGHRSILADPRNPDMRDHINFKIKKREWYRPLAPAILEEYVSEYFDTTHKSDWMQFVAAVNEKYREVLPAITHVDGTARLQTVSKKNNKEFYQLIEEFQKISGIPMLLNTSLNIKGEPIAETPQDAISAFENSDIDVLAIEEYIIVK